MNRIRIGKVASPSKHLDKKKGMKRSFNKTKRQKDQIENFKWLDEIIEFASDRKRRS